MLEKIVVVAIIVAALFIALRSMKRALTGEKGCSGGCACSGKKQQTCGHSPPETQNVEISQKP